MFQAHYLEPEVATTVYCHNQLMKANVSEDELKGAAQKLCKAGQQVLLRLLENDGYDKEEIHLEFARIRTSRLTGKEVPSYRFVRKVYSDEVNTSYSGEFTLE